MSESAERFRRVAMGFTTVVARIPDSAWEQASPCAGWTARDVVRHLVDWIPGPGFLLGTYGIEVTDSPSVDSDPLGAWVAVRDAVQAGLDDPVQARQVEDCGPLGRLAFEAAVDIACTPDVFVHTWDLAQAAGIDAELDETELRQQLEQIASTPPEVDAAMRSSGQYGPRIDIGADADPVTAVMAFYGRRARSAGPTIQRRVALPHIVDHHTWQQALDELRVREKAATRELDAIAAARRRLPAVRVDDYTLIGEHGPVRLVDIFQGKHQLITYHHMWEPGAEWQCPGCTGFTSQFTRLEFLDAYDARFVIVTPGTIDEALAYRQRVGNTMEWYSTAESSFGADMGAPLGGGFQVNVFLRADDQVYRTYNTQGRGTEQLGHIFGLLDILPYGRQEDWQDAPPGWPQAPTYSHWPPAQDFARYATN